MNIEQTTRALSQLGIEWTRRGDDLTILGDEPDEQTLEDAYTAWEQAEEERAARPAIDERLADLEAATGTGGGGQGQRGIADRLDALEDRITALEAAG